jgi:hypothetical protein
VDARAPERARKMPCEGTVVIRLYIN